AFTSSLRWNDKVFGGMPSPSAMAPGVNPAWPVMTRARNTFRRTGWARAASAFTTSLSSIVPEYSNYMDGTSPKSQDLREDLELRTDRNDGHLIGGSRVEPVAADRDVTPGHLGKWPGMDVAITPVDPRTLGDQPEAKPFDGPQAEFVPGVD